MPTADDPHLSSARKLVRSFSDDLEPEMAEETLGKALIKKEAEDKAQEMQLVRLKQDWNTLLISTVVPDTVPSDQKHLYEASQRLAIAWQKFILKLPEDQRPNVNAPPSLPMLQNAVVQAKNSWELRKDTTKRGKLHNAFTATMTKFHNHKDLLAVLPRDDKYVCLLTGSLSAIAKATVNHSNIAEEISTTLDQLDDDMDYWKRQMKLHKDNVHMRAYIIRLFVIIFEMLADIFRSWYASRWDRFKHSFDGDFLQRTVQARRAQIQYLKQRLEDEGNLKTGETIQEIYRALQDVPSRAETQAMNEAMVERLWLEIEKRIRRVGESTQSMLVDQGVLQLKRREALMIQPATDDDSDSIGTERETALNPADDSEQVASSEKLPSFLEKYIRKEVEEGLIERSGRLQIDSQVFQSIKEWSSSKESACLWVEGPHDVETPSQNTLTLASMLAAARAAEVPAAAYFCGEFTDYSGQDDFQERLLRDMVISLIAQLWTNQSPGIPNRVLVSNISILDNPNASLEAAVTSLELLAKNQFGVVLCLIDGLQLAEDIFTNTFTPVLKQVVDCLSLGSFKTCFTTDGSVDVLQRRLSTNRFSRVSFDFENETRRRGVDEVEMEDIGLVPDGRHD